jgi:hypothetical protein
MDNFVHNAANKTSEFLQYVVVISLGEFEAGGSSQVSFNVLKSFKFNVLYNRLNIIY